MDGPTKRGVVAKHATKKIHCYQAASSCHYKKKLNISSTGWRKENTIHHQRSIIVTRCENLHRSTIPLADSISSFTFPKNWDHSFFIFNQHRISKHVRDIIESSAEFKSPLWKKCWIDIQPNQENGKKQLIPSWGFTRERKFKFHKDPFSRFRLFWKKGYKKQKKTCGIMWNHVKTCGIIILKLILMAFV